MQNQTLTKSEMTVMNILWEMPEGGTVSVKMDAHSCTVLADRAGGTLIVKGQSYPLECGKELTVTF